MKRFDRMLLAGQVLLDIIVINLGFLTAYWARYELQLGREVAVQNFVPWSSYLPIELSLMGILMAVFAFKGLYSLSRRASWVDELSVIASSATTAIALLIVVVFVYRPVFYSRLVFVYAWITVIVLLALSRYAVRRFKRAVWAKGIGRERVLVVGADSAGQRVMQGILAHPNLGYRLVGFVDDNRKSLLVDLPGLEPDDEMKQSLGTTSQIPEIVRQRYVDEVIIALPQESHERILGLVEVCRRTPVSFRFVPDVFEMSFNEVDLDEVNGIPLVGIKETAIKGGNYYLKRTLDVALALVAMIILSPFVLCTSMMIIIESRGPVFFKQVRVGKAGRTFLAYKFRSMKAGAERELAKLLPLNEASGPIFKMKQDPRVTRIGKFMRRTSWDEVPQLMNVLLGEMSWVGPRPPVPSEVEKYDDWHKKRLEVTPGLTGLWQVSGRSDLSFDEMVRLDLYYAENWSLWLDLKILMLTIPAVITGRGAY